MRDSNLKTKDPKERNSKSRDSRCIISCRDTNNTDDHRDVLYLSLQTHDDEEDEMHMHFTLTSFSISSRKMLSYFSFTSWTVLTVQQQRSSYSTFFRWRWWWWGEDGECLWCKHYSYSQSVPRMPQMTALFFSFWKNSNSIFRKGRSLSQNIITSFQGKLFQSCSWKYVHFACQKRIAWVFQEV